MNVKVLGSVSPYCKNELNCCGYLVVNDNTKIILDCGNGTSRHLNFPHDLNDLCVILSHLHKDHYADLSAIYYANLVNMEHNIVNSKIKVYIPKCNKGDHDYIDYLLIHSYKKEYIEVIDYDESTVLTIDDIKVDFKRCKHSNNNCFYIRLKGNDKTLVYSGDTSDETKDDLISLANNTDLLICETSLLKEAVLARKTHLYTYEAGLIAKEANVKKLMITHFYPEISKYKYLEETKEVFNNTIIAVENEITQI